ncbi:A disintegrin and metalloproteinase with thrombospondin motifs 13 [Tetrabaena socialis]|uniref:A disintegrin and metalloproteinase with thrombospondin motifs 13 n=1 Tax=Tetrabaena socialis TaxID=47790 RepID=A0A2J8AKA8_9CHLO|nr:A disintegrin and metalloproteinase with thrombospondin motifs 13 [Tetrabaena socialis]|eukprot:PNH12954.1 A disintegrin and metalloproteinase with thrombospondin motifs 13 [Tetrabaena socialis]
MQVFSNFNVHPAKATIKDTSSLEATIIPFFTVKLWKLVPFGIAPEFTMGIQGTLNGAGCAGLGYQLYYSMALAFSLEEISLIVPVINKKLSIGAPWLPRDFTVSLIPQTDLTCGACSGCLQLAGSSGQRTYWFTGPWGDCSSSEPGGRGSRSRAIECRRKGGSSSSSEVQVDDGQCQGTASRPADNQECNGYAVSDQCPWSCTNEMLANEECDRECMLEECGYDAGQCQQQLNVATACLAATSCIDCLLQSACGWCDGTAECMPGSSAGPFSDFTCPGTDADSGWWTGQCFADERRLLVVSPVEGDFLQAGNSYNIAWEGGDGPVHLYVRPSPYDAMTNGLGLPTGAITNAGSGTWTVPAGTPSSSQFQLVVFSTSDDANYGVSRVFTVQGSVDAYAWFPADLWSTCSTTCGGGLRTLLCDDGCTGKAKWVEAWRDPCNRACGGGMQRRSYSCLGYYNPGCGGLDYQCARNNTCQDYQCQGPDPGQLLYECNTQPCPVYSWAAEDWGACSKACGGGDSTRTVTCVLGAASDKNGETVDSSNCEASGLQPGSTQACNTQACDEAPLELLSPNPGSFFQAGGDVNVSWAGGMGYGTVSVQAALVASGLAACPGLGGLQYDVSSLEWLAHTRNLPTLVENTGWAIWTIPAGLTGGWYLLRVVSGSDVSNIGTATAPLAVQADTSYTAFFVPLDAASELMTSFQVVVQGALGATNAVDVNLGNVGMQTEAGGAKALTWTGLDVGLVVAVNLLISDNEYGGDYLPPVAAVVMAPGCNMVQVGFPESGPGQALAKACGIFNGSCHSCAIVDGCGYCQDTGECMALGAGGAAPAAGSCPSASWAWHPDYCVDRCPAYRACDTCLAVVGCGWCPETCSCLGTDPATLAPATATCDSSSWLAVLPDGQTCASADATAGSNCPIDSVVAASTVFLVVPEDANESPYIQLSGYLAPVCSCGRVGTSSAQWGDPFNCQVAAHIAYGWDCFCECPGEQRLCEASSNCRWCITAEYAYQWTILDGPFGGPNEIIILNPNDRDSRVIGLNEGLYRFGLTVTDNAGNSATVQPAATEPSAAATSAQAALTAAAPTLATAITTTQPTTAVTTAAASTTAATAPQS